MCHASFLCLDQTVIHMLLSVLIKWYHYNIAMLCPSTFWYCCCFCIASRGVPHDRIITLPIDFFVHCFPAGECPHYRILAAEIKPPPPSLYRNSKHRFCRRAIGGKSGVLNFITLCAALAVWHGGASRRGRLGGVSPIPAISAAETGRALCPAILMIVKRL